MYPKKNELPILRELMKDPKRSDKGISLEAGVSQPTVSRARNRLEEKGIIESYQVIPNLQKLGFEILAFTLVPGETDEKEVREDQNIVWCLRTNQGTLYVSVHKNYQDFLNLAMDSEIQILTSTNRPAIKQLTFADLPI